MAWPRALHRAVRSGAVLATVASCDHASGDGMAAYPTEQAYWVEEVATGLDAPRAMAWLPNGDMLISEWAGKIRVLRDGKVIADLQGVPPVYRGFYDGLRDIKLDPGFADNRMVYLTFTTGDDQERFGKVFRARLERHTLVDGRVIFRAVPPMPGGGPIMLRILFLPDTTLLVGVGSGDQANIALVQRLDNHIGKIIRIHRDGSVPKDNPFLTTPGALPEIWALGLRNPSGFARLADGSLWAVDNGPKGGDELNELTPGANYGWPLLTWGFDYSGKDMSTFSGSTGRSGGKVFTDPALVWSPSFTPSDLAHYRGTTYPFWDGDLFVSGLSGQSLRRIRVRDGKVVLQEQMLAHLHERFRSVQLGPDNALYLLTDAYEQGRLLRLRSGAPARDALARVAKPLWDPSSGKEAFERAAERIYEAALSNYRELKDYTYDPVKGGRYFAQFCSGCHTFGKFTTGHIGPDLNGVNGRRSGQLPGYDYSSAFRDPGRELVWNYLTLPRFLQQPQVYFPGTRMNIPPLPPMAVPNIVDLLTDGELTASEAGESGSSKAGRQEKVAP